jgi:hypothetical protein
MPGGGNCRCWLVRLPTHAAVSQLTTCRELGLRCASSAQQQQQQHTFWGMMGMTVLVTGKMIGSAGTAAGITAAAYRAHNTEIQLQAGSATMSQQSVPQLLCRVWCYQACTCSGFTADGQLTAADMPAPHTAAGTCLDCCTSCQHLESCATASARAGVEPPAAAAVVLVDPGAAAAPAAPEPPPPPPAAAVVLVDPGAAEAPAAPEPPLPPAAAAVAAQQHNRRCLL